MTYATSGGDDFIQNYRGEFFMVRFDQTNRLQEQASRTGFKNRFQEQASRTGFKNRLQEQASRTGFKNRLQELCISNNGISVYAVC